MMLSSVANAENISIDNSPLSFEGKWKQRTIGQGQRMGKPRTAA